MSGLATCAKRADHHFAPQQGSNNFFNIGITCHPGQPRRRVEPGLARSLGIAAPRSQAVSPSRGSDPSTAFLICPSHCVYPDGLLETFETDFAEILEREHFSFAEFSDDI